MDMKNTIITITRKSLVALSAFLLINGCTLDMEDWVQTEEEIGYGETATMEYDGYKCEYEFKDETIHLTSNILEYLAYTEGDTTFYFMDNLPEEYRPKVGGYIASFCCDELPLGVNAKVLSVTKSNGMLIVETKAVELAETFKQFNLEMDMDMRFTHADDSTSETRARRVKHKKRAMKPSANGSLPYDVDWATYDYMVSGGKQTRTGSGSGSGSGSGAFDYDKDMDDKGKIKEEDKVFECAICEAELDIQEIIKEAHISLTAKQKAALDKISKVKFGLYSEETMHVYKIINVAAKREYTKTTTKKGYRIRCQVSKGTDILAILKEQPKLKSILEELLKKHVKAAALVEAFKGGVYAKPVPLGTVPGVFRVKPTVTFIPAIIGNVDVYIWTDTAVTETEAVDDKVVMDKEPVQNSSKSYEFSANAVAEAKLSGSIELFFGVGTVTPPNSVVGIGVTASVSCEASFSMSHTIAGDEAIAKSSDGLSASASISIGGKAILGKWVDYKFADASWEIWKSQPVQYYPTVKNGSYTIKTKRDEDNRLYRDIDFSYKVNSQGGVDDGWFYLCKPELMVVEGEYMTFYEPTNVSDAFVETNKSYQFKIIPMTYDSAIEIYPFFRSTSAQRNNIRFQENKLELPALTRPQVDYFAGEETHMFSDDEYWLVHQTEKPKETTVDDDDACLCTFELGFELKNASGINNYWKDWGFYYAVKTTYDDKTRTSDGVYTSLKNKITKNGKYEIEKKFYSTYSKGWFDFFSKPKIEVEAYLYYTPMEEPNKKKLLIGSPAEKFMVTKYSNKKEDDYRFVNSYVELDHGFSTDDRPSWYHKYKTITLDAK